MSTWHNRVPVQANTPNFLRCRLALGVLWLLLCTPAAAYDVVVDKADHAEPGPRAAYVLPYAFHTDLLQNGFGVVRVKHGQWQPQDTLVLTAYATSNESWGLAATLRHARLGAGRWTVSPLFYLQRNTEQRFYAETGFGVDETQGGSNDSGVDDYFQGKGWNAYAEAEFRYLLPIGLGRSEVVHRYQTDQGLLTGDGTGGDWNPMTSGRTTLVLKPFAMRRTMIVNQQNIVQFPPFYPVTLGQRVEHQSNGIVAFLEYDNRDFEVNPSAGSLQRLGLARDFGWFGSSDSWTSVEAEARKYFDLGRSAGFRQRVLALDAWAAYSPTWKLTRIGNAFRIANAPPENMGASLGGLHRMRGYPTGRFSDKAAVYYSAELRLIPKWNPMRSWPLLRDLSWRWWQWVAFAEIGRVAPAWDLATLHRDMKWSIGASLRAMIGSGVARLEIARSAEDTELIIMFGHPF